MNYTNLYVYSVLISFLIKSSFHIYSDLGKELKEKWDSYRVDQTYYLTLIISIIPVVNVIYAMTYVVYALMEIYISIPFINRYYKRQITKGMEEFDAKTKFSTLPKKFKVTEDYEFYYGNVGSKLLDSGSKVVNIVSFDEETNIAKSESGNTYPGYFLTSFKQ